MTPQQQTFINAYNKCMGVAPDSEIEYFFKYREMVQLVDSLKEAEYIRNGALYWGHIEDAWLLWREAIEYARGHK